MSFALQLAGSLVAILLLAGFARWLKLGRTEPLTEAEALQEAAAALPGLHPRSARLAPDARSAIIEGTGGRAEVRAHGARWIVRAL